ncbi:T9SS type B sorting domain-containing protein, partial [Flavobacterium jejuense]
MKKLLLSFISLFTLISYGQLTEDFEGTSVPTLPTWNLTSGSWAILDNTIGTAQSWQLAPVGQAYAGTRAAYLNRENVPDGTFALDWLITPSVNIPSDGQLRFYTKLTQAGIQGSNFTIRIADADTYAQNDMANFTIIKSWNESELMNGTTTNEQTNYIQKVVDLNPYVGQNLYIAFVMENDNGDRWFIDNVNVDEKCLDNTNLSATPLATSASLAWTSPSTATQWEIEYGPVGFTQGTGTTIIVNSNPYNLTGLLSLTNYSFYVRSLCASDNVSSWSGPTNFTTSALPPSCGGNFIDEGGVSGSYSNNSDYVITICPDNPGDQVTVNFTAFNTEDNWDALYIYDGNSTAAPQIASTNGAGNVPGGLPGGYWGTTLPGTFTASGPTGCLTFRFRSDSSGVRDGWTANVTCAPAPTCLKPTSVTISNITSSQALIDWVENNGATAWEIEYGPVGFTQGTGTTVSVTTNPYTLSGLNTATPYDVYIKSICSPTDDSAWQGPVSLTTLPDYCGGDIFYDQGGISGDYSNNSDYVITICPENPGDQVTVDFTAFNTEANWDALYIFDGNSTAAPQIASTNDAGNVPGGLSGGFWGTTIPGPFTASGPSGCLTFRFRSDTSGVRTGWAANVTCAPAPTCLKPTGIIIDAITDAQAQVSWTDNTGATTWEIEYGPAGFTQGNGTIVSTTTNPYTLTSLTAGTIYEVYVRAVCSSTDSSAWEGPSTFNTTICDPINQCNYSFILTDSFGDGWNGNTMNISQNGIVVGIIGPSFTTGNGPITIQIPICDGVPFELFWNSGGNYPNEVGIQIIDPFGDSLYTHPTGAGMQNTLLYSGVGECTPPSCFKPTDLSLVVSQGDSATVTWTENNPGVTSWQIVVQPVGTGYPNASSIIIPANSNPFTITGLNPSTQYEFYVSSDCGAIDGISNWQGPHTFETQLTNCYSSNLVPQLIGDAQTLGECCFRITENLLSQGGAVWYDNVINLNTDFQIIFEAGFGDDDNGADGIAFVLKKDATPVIGVTGTGIGYQGIDNSLAVEFDTYDNGFNGDIPADHLAILANGNTEHNNANNLAGPIAASSTSDNIEDGVGHEVKILWEVATQTLTVVFDCNQRLTYTGDIINTIFGGDPNVYFGFTGSTGGFSNQQELCFKYLSFTDPYSLADKTICANSSITDIDASYAGASNYLWTPSDGVSDVTLPNPVFTPTANTTYTVEITDECGFIIEQSFSVEVLDPITASVVENTSPICENEDAIFNITGTPNSTVNYTINGVSDFINLSGSGNATVTSSNAMIDQTIILTSITTSSTTLTHHAINATGGIDPVNALGPIETAGTNATNLNATQVNITNPLLILELDDLVPVGTSIIISAAKGDAAGEITVTDGNTTTTLNSGTISELNQTVFTTTVATNSITLEYTAGSYWIDGITYDFIFSGCNAAIDETATVVVAAPAPATFNTITLCQGDLDTALPTLSFEGYTGTWNASNIDTSTTGSLTYTFTPDAGQCATDGSLNVEITSKTMISFEEIEACLNSNTNFPTVSTEGYTLAGTWTPSTIANSAIGDFTYTFMPEDPCYDTGNLTVTTIQCTIQKGISPNNDGKNDSFDLSYFNVNKLEIFNRYGREVYTKSNYEDEWSGQTNNGDELPDGTYYYVIEFADMDSKTGWIYINRQQ